MIKPRRFLLPPLSFLIVVALLLAACGSQEDSVSSGAAEANSSPAAEDRPTSSGVSSEPSASFEPALLLSSKHTAQFAVDIPAQPKNAEEPREPIKVLLDSPAPYVLTVRLVAECATRRGQKELSSKIPEVKAAIVEHISGKTPDFVASVAGRAKLREEILQILQRQMRNKAIKQIYFVQYFVAPGKV